MCGICGYINLGKGKINKKFIKPMCSSLFSRGPDDYGTFSDKNASIGMRRLSIIDLNTGHQPITNEAEDKWIIFNGEIYNFKELRNELIEKKHSFKTDSDTEVILHLYEECGEECVKKLDGMFAFCIYDIKKKTMFLARDRIGKKPLHYFANNKIFIFSSEIKSLLQHPLVSKEIDMSSVKKYFLYGYVPAPNSIFSQIKKLMAGHYMIIGKKEISIKKYWDVDFSSEEKLNKKEIKKKIQRLLYQSIEKRLISDVPLGVFLSGGIDSSLIVAMMSEIKDPKEINTFTIGFKEGAFDESKYAEKVADIFGTKHKTKIISCKYALKKIPEIIGYIDEPMADPSVIPTYLLSEFIRKYITVALGGDGGDELFGGYPKYYMHRIADIYSKFPKIFDNLFELIPISQDSNYFNYKIKRFAKGSKHPRDLRNQIWVGSFLPEEIDLLLSDKFESNEEYAEVSQYLNQEIYDKKNKTMFLDLKLTLQDMYLVKVDRMSMANSLEVRNPLLDYKLVEFCSLIPSKYKVSFLKTKKLLKEIALEYIPKNIVNRKKTGFGIPLARWLRQDLKEFVLKTLSEEKIKNQKILNYDYIKKILDENQEGIDHANKIWSLLIFQLWFDNYKPIIRGDSIE